jgi:hypothetical protein
LNGVVGFGIGIGWGVVKGAGLYVCVWGGGGGVIKRFQGLILQPTQTTIHKKLKEGSYQVFVVFKNIFWYWYETSVGIGSLLDKTEIAKFGYRQKF